MQYSLLHQYCYPEWLELIDLKKKTIHIKKGKHLFQQGEKVDGIFFIHSGVIKIHVPWGEDKEMILRFAKAGDIAGHRGIGINNPTTPNSPTAPNNTPVYPISATALEDATATFLTNDFFETTLKANPNLTYALMHLYAAELQRAEQKMRNLTHMEVKGRIALALLDIESTFGTGKDKYITLALTRQDIASYAGTTYETVFKFFTELVDRKIITTSGKNIRILKPAALHAYIP